MLADKSKTFLGARNLLINCAEMRAGQSLLILYESSENGYFDQRIVDEFSAAAQKLGLKLQLQEVPFHSKVCDPSPKLMAKMASVDRTLFLARLGDQIRFRPCASGIRSIVNYALDGDMLASDFGRADYRAFDTLKTLINSMMLGAGEIHVTCPLGTDFIGHCGGIPSASEDVMVKRFPMSVFTPIPAFGFSGRIAQAGFLIGTGSHYYNPYACKIEDTLFVDFKDHKITGFDGNPRDIAAARAHYDFVGKSFDIDQYFVHSWHAGIHPGCSYNTPASQDFKRWSGGAFGNPRLLHFHTCGAYAPGEISLNVLDPTIRVDGVAVWEDGRLYPKRIPGGAEVLEVYPCASRTFENRAMEVGQGANGQLSFH